MLCNSVKLRRLGVARYLFYTSSFHVFCFFKYGIFLQSKKHMLLGFSLWYFTLNQAILFGEVFFGDTGLPPPASRVEGSAKDVAAGRQREGGRQDAGGAAHVGGPAEDHQTSQSDLSVKEKGGRGSLGRRKGLYKGCMFFSFFLGGGLILLKKVFEGVEEYQCQGGPFLVEEKGVCCCFKYLQVCSF